METTLILWPTTNILIEAVHVGPAIVAFRKNSISLHYTPSPHCNHMTHFHLNASSGICNVIFYLSIESGTRLSDRPMRMGTGFLLDRHRNLVPAIYFYTVTP